MPPGCQRILLALYRKLWTFCLAYPHSEGYKRQAVLIGLLCTPSHQLSYCAVPPLACTLRAFKSVVLCMQRLVQQSKSTCMPPPCGPPLQMQQCCSPNTPLHRDCHGDLNFTIIEPSAMSHPASLKNVPTEKYEVHFFGAGRASQRPAMGVVQGMGGTFTW